MLGQIERRIAYTRIEESEQQGIRPKAVAGERGVGSGIVIRLSPEGVG